MCLTAFADGMHRQVKIELFLLVILQLIRLNIFFTQFCSCFLAPPSSQSGFRNFPLIMSPSGISTDEYLPLNFLWHKGWVKQKNSTEFLPELLEFWNYGDRLRFYVTKLLCCDFTINVPLQIGKYTPLGTCNPGSGTSGLGVAICARGQTLWRALTRAFDLYFTHCLLFQGTTSFSFYQPGHMFKKLCITVKRRGC